MQTQAFVVSLYAAGNRRPSDCWPDFLPTRTAAIEAGEEALRIYDWAVRYTIRRVNWQD